MRRLLHLASAVSSWLVAVLVLAVGFGLAWQAVLRPLDRGGALIGSECVFAVGVVATGLALVLACLRPRPAFMWFAAFTAVLAIFLQAATWLVSRANDGHAIEPSEYMRMAVGIAVLGGLAWRWRRAVLREGPTDA